MEERNEVS